MVHVWGEMGSLWLSMGDDMPDLDEDFLLALDAFADHSPTIDLTKQSEWAFEEGSPAPGFDKKGKWKEST